MARALAATAARGGRPMARGRRPAAARRRRPVRAMAALVLVGAALWAAGRLVRPRGGPSPAGPGRGLPGAATGNPLLDWLSDRLIDAIHVERRFDPFVRPAFDARLREPLSALL